MSENKPPYPAFLIILLVLMGVITLTAFTGDLLLLLVVVGMFGGGFLITWAIVKIITFMVNQYGCIDMEHIECSHIRRTFTQARRST